MVWGCMTWEEVGNLRLIEGKMDKYIYREVLEMELMNTIHMHDLEEENVIFQHNNDPKHTSKWAIASYGIPNKCKKKSTNSTKKVQKIACNFDK